MHDLWDAQIKVSGNGLVVDVLAITITLADMCILFMGFRLI